MKKILVVAIAFCLVVSFPACGSGKNAVDTNNITEDKIQNSSNVLIVYFSLLGNSVSDKAVDASTSASIMAGKNGFEGTTELIAGMIQETVGGDIHRIQTVELYPDDFNAVIDQNHDEMNRNYLPPLKNSNLNIRQYDIVFIGYPVWASSVPQAILSFLSENDLSGKTVIPFCTHDGYGSGRSYTAIEESCPKAALLNGIAIEAKDVPSARNRVTEWLRTIGLAGIAQKGAKNNETPITITIGDTVLNGVWYNTALAEEIKALFPLTVSMGGYGGREYYGGISQRPVNVGKGKLNFDNGDITYCGQNNTMAIFYAQTDRPNLGMEVIPIGKVTSDLTVFHTMQSRIEILFKLAD